MKRYPQASFYRQGPLLVSVLALSAFCAHLAPAQVSTRPLDDTKVALDPFVVNATQDVGFVAASSLAGGRIATPLKDTPVAYSVITAEFLEAFNLTDVASATEWSVNSTVVDGDGTNRGLGSSIDNGALRTRGVTSGVPTRNFFPFIISTDSYALDRVDFGRGPNAVLFGAGGVGGTVNSVTKQANADRNFESVRVQLGSFNRYRFTGDVNHALNSKVGLRTNVMWDQSDTWRLNEWKDRYGVHLSGVYKPTSKLTIRAEGEYSRSRELKGTTSPRDFVSAWDGTTTFASIPTVLPTNVELAAAGVTRLSNMRWVRSDSFGDIAQNFEGRYITKGAAHSGTPTLTNQINGVPIRTPGFTLHNQALVDDNSGVPEDRLARAIAGTNGLFQRPERDYTSVWTNHRPSFTERGKDFAMTANYKLNDNLFFEIAGDVNQGAIDADLSLSRRGGQDIFIDLNSLLPSGAVNPNFLHPYTEQMAYRTLRTNDMKNFRAQALYAKDTRIGRLQFSVMGGSTEHKTISRSLSVLLPLTTYAADARSWVDGGTLNPYALFTRVYLDQPDRTYEPSLAPVTLFNPINGTTETITPAWMYDTAREDNNRNSLREYKFIQAAGNLDLFKNRLVLIGAFRRDFTTIADKRVVAPGDMPAGWDGTSIQFREDAPADYYELKYFPKNAAGVINGPETLADVRPRANIGGANLRQPQYANDRFRDDYDSPAVKRNINTFTVGGVVNITRWLGAYANVAETFSLTPPSQKPDGTLVPPTSSQGKDYGVRVNLPNGKLSVSLGHFTSYQAGTAVTSPANFVSSYNAISDAPVVGDLSPVGRNIRNVARFPTNVYSTATTETNGYEFELTANFTRAWRMILNAGKTKAMASDQYPDIIAYFATQDPIARQILADAGILINANNDASINPVLNNPISINQTRVQAAVNGWNVLNDTVIPNTTGLVPQEIAGTSKWVGNIATDYRFQSGPLKGLRVGGGINYRGGQVAGYRGSDTIVDPNNPLLAIDDPTVSAATSVYAPSYYKGVASLSYTFKLKNGRSLQLDFNVDNLFNRREPIFGNAGGTIGTNATSLRPRDGDITSLARITTPTNFSYLVPRNYSLSAKYVF